MRRRPSLGVGLVLAIGLTGCGSPATSPSAASSAPVSPSSRPSAASTCRPADQAATHWWDDRVFYEIFVRSFQDSNGDGIGDLQGLIDRLDYLNDGDAATTDDLGVTGIWLMPVAEAASYHGYDVTDYRAIEPDYGTTDDFRRLVTEAHRRGIAVIVDQVLNHTSSDHPWFQNAINPGSEHDDWYIWSEKDPGYGGPDGQRVWHRAGARFYYGLFGPGMPDLDLTNPDVEGELDGIARYWLDDLGVDGFRLDAIKHFVEDGESQENTPATHDWLAGFHDRVRAAKPDALLVGEAFDASIVSSSYVPGAVDLTFDFELAGKLLNGARVGDGDTVRGGQAGTLERYGGSEYAAFLTNHDQNRVASTLPDPGARRVAASLLLTNPGVPFLYYGEEIGLPGTKPDERIRTPLPWAGSTAGGFSAGTPWEPLEDGWESRNVAAQVDDPSSLLTHYRALIGARSDLPQLRTAEWIPLEPSDDSVYAFLAADTHGAVSVVINLGDETVVDPVIEVDATSACLSGTAAVAYADGFDADPALAPIAPPTDGGDVVDWRPVNELPPQSTLIVRLAP